MEEGDVVGEGGELVRRKSLSSRLLRCRTGDPSYMRAIRTRTNRRERTLDVDRLLRGIDEENDEREEESLISE